MTFSSFRSDSSTGSWWGRRRVRVNGFLNRAKLTPVSSVGFLDGVKQDQDDRQKLFDPDTEETASTGTNGTTGIQGQVLWGKGQVKGRFSASLLAPCP